MTHAHELIEARSHQADWIECFERVFRETEAAELSLAAAQDGLSGRKSNGSFYTPADVADHFWTLFLRHHNVVDAESFRDFICRTDFVEPSVGSGIFVYTFLRKALTFGLSPAELSNVRFHAVDINLAALRFLSEKLREIEAALDISLAGIGYTQGDFLEWSKCHGFPNVAFVGNPPFVTNERNSKWRNLYADFIDAMLNSQADWRAISLIIPVSLCFSRDFLELRRQIVETDLPLSISSYDNIPDCLFKMGKPESTNTNRANSQRCAIINLGGARKGCFEATPLMPWTAGERSEFLRRVPPFADISHYDFDEQFPRPTSTRIIRYLEEAKGGVRLGELTNEKAEVAFKVAGVARNFIGIRDSFANGSGMISVRPTSDQNSSIILQVLASEVFFEYWKSLGDGFHVTRDLVYRFPISPKLMSECVRRSSSAKNAWRRRAQYAKEKLNAGKIVRSYDMLPAIGIPMDHQECV